MSSQKLKFGLFYYPLTKQDIARLNQGKLVTKNFSPLLRPDVLICAVAWNKSRLGKLDKRKFDNMRKGGIHVANIPLEDADIKKIEDGNGTSAFYDDFEILVLTEQTLQQLQEGEAKRLPLHENSENLLVYETDSLGRPWLVCQKCGKKSPAWGVKERTKCRWCGFEHREGEASHGE